MLRATANFLHGEDFLGMGVAPPTIEPLADIINKLPRLAQEVIYTAGSAGEAIPANLLRSLNAASL